MDTEIGNQGRSLGLNKSAIPVPSPMRYIQERPFYKEKNELLWSTDF